MNNPTINYPRCKFCRYSEISEFLEQDERYCHFNPPTVVSTKTGIRTSLPIISLKTGGCNRMQPIDELVESEFEEVTEFDEDDRPSPPPSSNSTRRQIVHECMGENGSLVICKETI